MISRSCTTGWLDWVWGDLWLTADSVLRISRGMAETRGAALQRKRRGGGSTVTPESAGGGGVSALELEQKVGADKKNRCIQLREIRAARLRRGAFNSRLSVELDDGTRLKLLWLKTDPAFDTLRSLLEGRLGPALKIR